MLKNKDVKPLVITSEEVVGLIRRRAENLYKTHQLFCSEAVLYVINQGLGGGLAPENAIALGSVFSEGVGGSGCMCGAFSGALMALGLFLGRRSLNRKGAKRIQAKGRELHDHFRSEFRSTCCRMLTKTLRNDEKALFKQCAVHTGGAAEMAARLILEARPGLLTQVDWDFLTKQDSRLKAGLNRLLTLVEP